MTTATRTYILDGERPRRGVSAVCTGCAHLARGGAGRERRCAAFPGGIPDAIWNGEHDHRLPFAGDRGIRYEPASGVRTADAA